MPQRIQRRRAKGWRMPAGAVYVGRPTKWGNPFNVTAAQPRELALQRYRWWLSRGITHGLNGFPPQPQEIAQLRGKDLVCWCPLSQACHADVLLELANS
jgi:hypothetical protein